MQIKPDTKPPITTKLPKTESVYLLITKAGREYTISKADYEEISKIWADRENYGVFIGNAGSEDEVRLLVQNIDSISRGRRTEAV